ncbi:MAG: FAD-dependent oxidoreductase [Hyphomicrobium sp.]
MTASPTPWPTPSAATTSSSERRSSPSTSPARGCASPSRGGRGFQGDVVISTIPSSVLGNVEVTPRWSPEKQRLIRESRWLNTVKVVAQTRTPSWLKKSIYAGRWRRAIVPGSGSSTSPATSRAATATRSSMSTGPMPKHFSNCHPRSAGRPPSTRSAPTCRTCSMR